MRPAVAAVLADEDLVAQLVAPAAAVIAAGAQCETPGCDADHGTGRGRGAKFCPPCRADRRRASKKRWRVQHLASWRASHREDVAA